MMAHFSRTSTGVPTPFGQNAQGLEMENVTVHTKEYPKMIISNEILFWTQIIGSIGICSVIAILGMVANIINIVVFIRQGILSDSSTVSLFYLAINDFVCLFSLLWLAVCFALTYIRPPDLPFDLGSVLFITGGRPHVMFTQFTRWITFFISFERCMCVLFPFKVSTWFSPVKTAIIVPSIVLIIFCSAYLPMFATAYLRATWDSRRNKTIVKTYEASNYREILWVTGWLAGQGYQPAALLGTIICTQVMTIRLNVSRKWRKNTTAVSNQTSSQTTQGTVTTEKQETTKKADSRSIGSKDKRLVQMIRVISIVFLICYTPDFIVTMVINFSATTISPGGLNSNLYFFLYTFSFNLEAFNSGINIVIYYQMSSKYRKEFDKLFGRVGDKE